MADRLEWFSVTVPAGTPASAPVTFPLVFNDGSVVEIDVKVPPGPSGNLAFFIGAGGSQYVPRTKGSFVIPDSDYFTWPLDNAINSGSWSVTAYNTGVYPHTFEIGFQVNERGSAHLTPASQLGSSSAELDTAVGTATGVSSTPVDPLSADFLIASLQDA